jgi:hypothetical protein
MDLSLTDEHTLITDEPQLRQGDIFVWHDRNYRRPWQTFGILITADCDLVQDKTHGRLSYLPALTMEDYLWTFWRPEKFGPVLLERETTLESRLNKCLSRLRGSGAGISKEAAIAWVRRAGADQLITELGLTDPGQIKDLRASIDAYVLVRDLIGSSTPDLDLLRKCYPMKNKRASESDHTDLARELQNSVTNLPGDVFYLSGIDGLEQFGLFVMLRHVSQCDASDLAKSPDELRLGTAKAKRVARLNSPYVFALAQNLARVFSDIGLPKSYDDRRKISPIRYFDAAYGKVT